MFEYSFFTAFQHSMYVLALMTVILIGIMLARYVWNWVDDNELKLIPPILFKKLPGRPRLVDYPSRGVYYGAYINEITGSYLTNDEKLTKGQRLILMKKYPELFEPTQKVSYITVAFLLGVSVPIVFWFILEFFLFTMILSVIVVTLFTTRFVRRLHKKFSAHEKDSDAHKEKE